MSHSQLLELTPPTDELDLSAGPGAGAGAAVLAGAGGAKAISSGGRALAELKRRRQAAIERTETRLNEIEDLQEGIDIGRPEVGGNGVKNYVVLTPVEDDERFFRQCQADPLLTAYFGGGNTGGGNTNSGGAGTGTGAGGGGVGQASEVGLSSNQGILSFVSRYKPFGWLSTNRLAVGLLSGLLLLLGLMCLMLVVVASLGRNSNNNNSSADTEATPTAAAPVVLVNPTATLGLEATVTAQAKQLTAIANQQPTPTATQTALPKTATATALPTTPSATPTPDFSQDPHNGLLPPARLSASKLGFNNDKVRRFATSADGQTLVSGPPKGVLYHFGAYPGERPGNLVLIGDYETLGNWFELLQVNDLMEVTDRNGGGLYLPGFVLAANQSVSGPNPR